MSHSDSPDDTTYSISELAAEFAVTPRAIRFYEDQGLISPRRLRQRRIYSRRDRARLRLTLRGKRLGMTLAEIRELFELYELAHGEELQLRRYLDILKEKRAKLLRQREDLEETLREVMESERRCQEILGRKQPSGRARRAESIDP